MYANGLLTHAATALLVGSSLFGRPVTALVGKPVPPLPGNGVVRQPQGYSPWAGKLGNQGGAATGTAGTPQGGGRPSAATAPDCSAVPPPQECLDPTATATGVVQGPAVTPRQLALFASRDLVLPMPRIRTAPPRGDRGVVGLRHFFWSDSADWRSRSQRAQAGPVWAEVTAVPSRLVIHPGDGTVIDCAGPGVPYDFTRSPDEQDIRCTHVYERSSAGLPASAYRLRAEVVWSATWVGSGGAGGVLPPVVLSEEFPLRIAEGQALVQKRSA